MARRHLVGAAALALAWFWGIGCGTLDTIDHVQDLRVLGVRAEPPDQPISVTSDLTVLGATMPVQVTALVADPCGLGRPITYSFAVCAKLDTGVPTAGGGGPPVASTSSATHRCLPSEYSEFAHGTAVAANGWVEISGTFTAASALLSAALVLDNYHGLDGLRLPVQLTISAGDQHIVGTKLVVYTIANGAPYTPNENPNLQGLNVEGAPWPEASPFVFSRADMPSHDGWRIAPVFDANLQVTYQQTSFAGTPLQFQELWLFDYFSTFGGFSPTSAGGQRIVSNVPESPDSKWLPPDGGMGPATFWFVVRDGRGGETWLVREAQLNLR